MKKKILRVVAVLGIALAAAGGWMVYKIGPRNVIGMLRYDQREEGSLRVGDAAPDVELRGLDGGSVRLAERIGDRPLVLIFGSYT